LADHSRISRRYAQYPDYGTIEREVSGAGVAMELLRERSADRLPQARWSGPTRSWVWHELRIDAAFIERIPRCLILARVGASLRPYRPGGDGKAGHSGLQHARLPMGTSEVADTPSR
jgi:hypothetical protein